MEKSFKLGFLVSNNEAEYETLLVRVRMSRQVGADRVQLHCDSQLVVSHITSEFKVKDQRKISYLKEVGILKYQFKKVEISHILRGSNNHVDSLASIAFSVEDLLLRIVTVELLPFSSLTPSDKGLVLSIHPFVSWMDPIVAYLQNRILLEDKKESERIRCRSPRY